MLNDFFALNLQYTGNAGVAYMGRAFALYAGDRGSIPGRTIPKSLKQVMTAPLPYARQQV